MWRLAIVAVCLHSVVGHPHPNFETERCKDIYLESQADKPALKIIDGASKITIIKEVTTTGNCMFMRYGFLGISIWSRGGCCGTFHVCYIPAHEELCYEDILGFDDPTKNDTEVVTNAGQISYMTVLEQLSTTDCIYPSNFHYDEYTIFTGHGCRARFRICYLPKPPLVCHLFDAKRLHNRVYGLGELLPHLFPLFVNPNATCFPWDYGVYNNSAWVNRNCEGYFAVCSFPRSCFGHGVGDPHVTSSDGAQFGVNPDCMYEVSATQPTNSSCAYRLLSKMEHRLRKGKNVTWIRFLEVHTQGHTIKLDKNNDSVPFKKVIYIDGNQVFFDPHHPSFCLPGGICLKVTSDHRWVVLTLNCGVLIIWDGHGELRFRLPPVFATWVRGLFGNCNLDRLDDLLDKTGEYAGNSASPGDKLNKGQQKKVALAHVVLDTSGLPSSDPECVP